MTEGLQQARSRMVLIANTDLLLNIRRKGSLFLPEVCLRGLYVCLTSDETLESF